MNYYIESYYRGFIQLLHHFAKLDNSTHSFSNLSHKITLYPTYNGIILENLYIIKRKMGEWLKLQEKGNPQL